MRTLLKGGTGLLAPGTDLALRLSDLTLPSAAGSTLGSTVKSFTTEFAVDRPITRYSLHLGGSLSSRPGAARLAGGAG